jgi:hypothetical protein
MLTLFKRLLTKEHMSMYLVKMGKWFLHLVCENNDDGVILKIQSPL